MHRENQYQRQRASYVEMTNLTEDLPWREPGGPSPLIGRRACLRSAWNGNGTNLMIAETYAGMVQTLNVV